MLRQAVAQLTEYFAGQRQRFGAYSVDFDDPERPRTLNALGGALRDIVQNHGLQLMAMFAMEPPVEFAAEDLRDEKLKVLRAVKPMTAEDVAANTIRGQYVSGWVEGERLTEREILGFVQLLLVTGQETTADLQALPARMQDAVRARNAAESIRLAGEFHILLAEMAGNAAGTIPPYTGGLTKAPAGWDAIREARHRRLGHGGESHPGQGLDDLDLGVLHPEGHHQLSPRCGHVDVGVHLRGLVEVVVAELGVALGGDDVAPRGAAGAPAAAADHGDLDEVLLLEGVQVAAHGGGRQLMRMRITPHVPALAAATTNTRPVIVSLSTALHVGWLVMPSPPIRLNRLTIRKLLNWVPNT